MYHANKPVLPLSLRLLSVALTWLLCFGAVPRAQAATTRGPVAMAAPAAPSGGRTVALLRFTGTPPHEGAELRLGIQGSLESHGWTVKSVALDLTAAANKVKCKGPAGEPECLATLSKWFNSNPKTAADYIVVGQYDRAQPRATVIVYDVAKGTNVETFKVGLFAEDQVVPLVLAEAVATSLDQHLTPPGEITSEEQAELLALDEPEKTPEELAAEQKSIDDAVAQAAAAAAAGQTLDTANIPVDLKADFKDYCRTGPRNPRKSKDDPKDLRPKCQRGPFWGYLQPRSWVTMGLTAGALIGTFAFYGAALAARGAYKDAVKEVDDYVAGAGGDPRRDPHYATYNGQSYDALATEVSRTGATVRQRAIVGDALLGTSVLLAGVLAIMISQDRRDAKNFIAGEKGQKLLLSRGLQIGPMIAGRTRGVAMGLHF